MLYVQLFHVLHEQTPEFTLGRKVEMFCVVVVFLHKFRLHATL